MVHNICYYIILIYLYIILFQHFQICARYKHEKNFVESNLTLLQLYLPMRNFSVRSLAAAALISQLVHGLIYYNFVKQ